MYFGRRVGDSVGVGLIFSGFVVGLFPCVTGILRGGIGDLSSEDSKLDSTVL